MITLYTSATPNGRKISIALEELGFTYEVKDINLTENVQKEDWYLKINPNGKIPAIIDHDANDITIFESGAILIYLAEKADRLLPSDSVNRFNVLQWLFLQVGGVGPMQGQANVFYRYMDNAIPEATHRYQNETNRLYALLDEQLSRYEYLAGDLSIADIAHYPWIKIAYWAGINIDNYDSIKAWLKRLDARESFISGINVPEDIPDAGILNLGKAIIVK
ncbi:MAG: glutathione S-transferase [Gammaproteobacteria bacterium]|nr:MAG: glutathione S-transferase [Gammaproteobacteria bacterium]